MTASSLDLGFARVVELGVVTDRSVRLWLRLVGQQRVEARLRVADGRAVTDVVHLSPDADWVGALDLVLPETGPNLPFSVEVAGRRIDGVFAPSPGERTGLVFGFGSCHQPFLQEEDGTLARKPEAAIYAAFQADLARFRARLLLLIGDQIYADGLPALDVHQADGHGAAAALDAYRRVYHQYFAEPGMRALRTHGPTLCLWDDHDILDNWGSRGDDEQDAVLFGAACRAYEQYQHARNPALAGSGQRAAGNAGEGAGRGADPPVQEGGRERSERGGGAAASQKGSSGALGQGGGRQATGWQPEEVSRPAAPPGDGGGPPYPFGYAYGDIAFLGLDLRGARDVDDATLLGREQWRRIEAFLAGEQARAAVTLFVVCTVPLAHPARWFARLLERAPGGYGASVRDRWAATAFLPERNRLLGALFGWQAAAPMRQVCVLSGDIHSGGAYVIRQRRGPGVIHQFIGSAFTSELSRVSRTANQVGALFPSLSEERYTFERRWLEFRRNYGLVRVRPAPEGGHRVEFVLKAWDGRRRRARVSGRVVTGAGSG